MNTTPRTTSDKSASKTASKIRNVVAKNKTPLLVGGVIAFTLIVALTVVLCVILIKPASSSTASASSLSSIAPLKNKVSQYAKNDDEDSIEFIPLEAGNDFHKNPKMGKFFEKPIKREAAPKVEELVSINENSDENDAPTNGVFLPLGDESDMATL